MTVSEDLAEAWEQGDPVEIRRSKGDTSVLSIRVQRSVLEQLTAAGKRQDCPPTRLARQFIEEGLARAGEDDPVLLARVTERLFSAATALKRSNAS